MATVLDRTWYNTLVDDDGSNTTGTVWNKAAVDSLMDAVDALFATTLILTGPLGIGTSSPQAVLSVSNGGAAGLEFNPTTGAILSFNRNTAAYSSLILNALTISFNNSGVLTATMDATGSLQIGGTAARGTTAGTKRLDIFDGTAPVGTLTNGCSIYSTAGELRTMDSAGNATLQTPHDHGPDWIFLSENVVTGKRVRIEAEKLLKRLNQQFGEPEWFIEQKAQDTNG